jgi:uncharacterized membrane protein YbaN (DUF454 family)
LIARVKRLLWVTLGLVSLVLGIIGVFLPLLPTTPFILLSALAFAESSPRLHQWLTNHPRWGVIIRNWQDGGRIDRQSKSIAVAVMAMMPLLSWALSAPSWAIGAQVLVLAGVAAFILTRPS